MDDNHEISDSERRYQLWLRTPEGQAALRAAYRAERRRIVLEYIGWALLFLSFGILAISVAVW